MLLNDKIAIVTGASRGIGRAISLKFASHGASIVLVADEDRDALEDIAACVKESGTQALVIQGDIADPKLSSEIIQKTVERFNTIDIALNCAGIITRTPIEELPLEEWYRVLDVNLHGTFHLCRAVLPVMKKSGRGKIINMSSQMARLPHPSASPSYEVSKAGIIALTRHLAYHYAKDRICVNAIAPGSINTRMPLSMSPEARERIRMAIPFQRLGEPEEVADAALFLASSLSDYITGATLDVNGGSYMA